MKKILFTFCLVLISLSSFSQLDTINNGLEAGDGRGESLYTAFQKVNLSIHQIDSNTLHIDTLWTAYSLIYTDTITIISDSLLSGADIVLVSPTVGYVTTIQSIKIKYDFNSTAYTVASGTNVTIQTEVSSSTLEDIITISDELFESDVTTITSASNSVVTGILGNQLVLSIPESKFTLGDSDIFITVVYTLEN